jgi:zinc transport system ATP-binding protein
MNALEVEHLTIRFGPVEVLSDLSFHVEAGTALAVIGPNGSGKTVLFRSLIGALPYQGTVRWAPGTRLGHVPQKLDLERDVPLSGSDLLRARAHLVGATAAEVDQTLARMGLSHAVLGSLIGTLSGGQFQRLLLAFALLGHPTVLLLDEPTAGVDEPGQEQFQRTLQRLQEEGVTLLLITHDLAGVYRYATNVLCLSRGHTCFGNPRSVLTPETLNRAYGGPVALHLHDESLA